MTGEPIGCTIRIGVTGHRALLDEAEIARAFREFLEAGMPGLLGSKSGRATAVPIRFCAVTALAEGADRVLAREVLKQPGGSLEVILPMPEVDYLADFANPESKAEFTELCRLATSVVVGQPRGDASRQDAYERAGRQIVDRCDLLAAVWDGQEPRGPGGTGAIVEFARRQELPIVIIEAESPHRVRVEADGNQFVSHLESLAELDVDVPADLYEAYLANVERGHFGGDQGPDVPEALRQAIRDHLLPVYVRASLVAKRNQRWRRLAGVWIPILSVVAVASVATGVLFRSISGPAFSFELAALVCILIVIALSERKRTHEKWIEFRVLAERVRHAVFLALCGMDPPLEGARGDWTVAALGEVWQRVRPHLGPGTQWQSARDFLRKRWLGEQAAFHKAKAERAGRLGARNARIGRVLFLAALVVSALHVAIFDAAVHLAERPLAGEGMWRVLSLLALVLPAAGAAAAAIRSHQEYARQEHQSRRLARRLTELELRMCAAQDREEFEQVIGLVHELFLQDARDWRALMRFAVLEAG